MSEPAVCLREHSCIGIEFKAEKTKFYHQISINRIKISNKNEISIRRVEKILNKIVTMDLTRTWQTSFNLLKFMFAKKATKIDKIFTVDLTLCSK